MTDRTMILGVEMAVSYGLHPGAWRMPHANPNAFIDVDVQLQAAKAAERGGLDFIFHSDRVFLQGDLETGTPMFGMEPLIELTAVARETNRIGLMASVSTSFNEPYTVARQLRALDLISNGRAAWNVVPSYEPQAFANYGRTVPSREEKYQRLHEVVQVTQALWGSWRPEAGQPDKASGRFADTSHIRPINLRGEHVGSRGPLQIPPSPQGQPVILLPASSADSIQLAGRYAGAVIGIPNTIEESRAQREMVRAAAVEAGRDADDVKFLSNIGFGLGNTLDEALARRRALDDHADLEPRLEHLSALLGVRVAAQSLDDPLSDAQLDQVQIHPGALKSERAVELARQGWSPRDIIAHGVLDPNVGLVGTAEQAADLLEEWFQAEACDGFILINDDSQDSMDAFTDTVVPVLRQRGLRPADYRGTTLRDHLGLKYQLGIDPRLSTGA